MEREYTSMDDLQRQLEQQMQGQGGTPPPSPLAPPVSPGGLPRNTTQPVGGATPLGGQNTGVTGGMTPHQSDLGATPPPMAKMPGGAMARYGTADIEGAGDLKAGNYGGEGFSYDSRAAAGERGGNTIKNSFGKIASRYDPTQAGAAKAVMADPDFQRLFPEATLVEHPNGDMIDFGDGKPVDVLRAARAGGAGEAWQWGVDDGSGGGGGGQGGYDINSALSAIGGGDQMGGIQSEIDKLINGQDPEAQTLIQKILAGEVQA